MKIETDTVFEWYVVLARIDGDPACPPVTHGPYGHEKATEKAEQLEAIYGARYRASIYHKPWPVPRSGRLGAWLVARLGRGKPGPRKALAVLCAIAALAAAIEVALFFGDVIP